MKHIDVKEIISTKDYVGKQVTVCGWVRTSRNSKSVAFVEVNDGTSRLQGAKSWYVRKGNRYCC